jgi:O-antigen ligase
VRGIAQLLLLILVFTIPWEYSLDLGEPLGPIARVAGVLLLLAAVPAVLQAGRVRALSALHWAVLALYLWICCSYFWTIEPAATLEKMRGFFQEMMIVWLVWEFAEGPGDLRGLLRAYVAGSWVLAALTLANFASPEAVAAGQIRFVAEGLDPNDAARFLDLGFPFAALLFEGESRWPGRLLAIGYLPLGLVAVLLTASRGGFLAAVAALLGCGLLLARGRPMRVLGAALALPALGAALWFVVPHETFDRLATISEQLEGGSLNDRVNIWAQGWQAFVRAPLAGTGAGTFVGAAGLAPIDTAHNTALSIAVGGGLIALFLFVGVVALVVRAAAGLRGSPRLAMATALLVWGMTSLTATVEENRTTWLLFALVAAAGGLARSDPDGLAACFHRRGREEAPEMRPAVVL